MGLPGRNQRRVAERAPDGIHQITAEMVDLSERRRKRDAPRHHPPKLYPEHFVIAAIVLASYAVAALALL